MSLRAWMIKIFFSGTAAAHAIRDAERDYPSEHDFVSVPLYDRNDLDESPRKRALAEVVTLATTVTTQENPR